MHILTSLERRDVRVSYVTEKSGAFVKRRESLRKITIAITAKLRLLLYLARETNNRAI